MDKKAETFWCTYRKDATLWWLYLIATPVVPVCLGVVNHFFLGATEIGAKIAEVISVVPFFLFLYHGWQYKLAVCPHCNQTAAKFKNHLFPIDPVCPKCRKRMDDGSED
jgi:hypothetical protein